MDVSTIAVVASAFVAVVTVVFSALRRYTIELEYTSRDIETLRAQIAALRDAQKGKAESQVLGVDALQAETTKVSEPTREAMREALLALESSALLTQIVRNAVTAQQDDKVVSSVSGVPMAIGKRLAVAELSALLLEPRHRRSRAPSKA